MNKELFKKMQNNWRILADLSVNEIACLKEHIEHVEMYVNGYESGWELSPCGNYSLNALQHAYHISPNYTPEPEITRCEVILNDGRYLFRPPNRRVSFLVDLASSFKGWYRFEFTDGALGKKCFKMNHGEIEHPTSVLFKEV